MIDIAGPLPWIQRGKRFILTICNYGTQYPDAIVLPRELINLHSRMGIPDDILTDQGTNFMLSLLEEVYKMLHITKIQTKPYHPQTNGLVERISMVP